jgi:hypothetical protein
MDFPYVSIVIEAPGLLFGKILVLAIKLIRQRSIYYNLKVGFNMLGIWTQTNFN